jgi:endoribonuclease Dicer
MCIFSMRQESPVLVVLVHQQSEYIRVHTDLTVGRYYGELGVDLWQKQRWMEEFEQHQVLVFTAQVFLNLVDHNVFRTSFV